MKAALGTKGEICERFEYSKSDREAIWVCSKQNAGEIFIPLPRGISTMPLTGAGERAGCMQADSRHKHSQKKRDYWSAHVSAKFSLTKRWHARSFKQWIGSVKTQVCQNSVTDMIATMFDGVYFGRLGKSGILNIIISYMLSTAVHRAILKCDRQRQTYIGIW